MFEQTPEVFTFLLSRMSSSAVEGLVEGGWGDTGWRQCKAAGGQSNTHTQSDHQNTPAHNQTYFLVDKEFRKQKRTPRLLLNAVDVLTKIAVFETDCAIVFGDFLWSSVDIVVLWASVFFTACVPEQSKVTTWIFLSGDSVGCLDIPREIQSFSGGLS